MGLVWFFTEQTLDWSLWGKAVFTKSFVPLLLFLYFYKLEIVIKNSRNSETLNGPTHSTIPNQPESNIWFHKKSPLQDFIRQTLIYYLVRHLASYCFCFLWVSLVKSSFLLSLIQVVPRKGSLFLILCNGPRLIKRPLIRTLNSKNPSLRYSGHFLCNV